MKEFYKKIKKNMKEYFKVRCEGCGVSKKIALDSSGWIKGKNVCAKCLLAYARSEVILGKDIKKIKEEYIKNWENLG